jgi:tetratricopeptide (TPR) repeat protein
MLSLPSAEFSTSGHWPPALSKDERSKRVAALEDLIKKSSGPYFKSVFEAELAWHRGIERRAELSGKEGAGLAELSLKDCTDIMDRWKSAGRDDRERVAALYQLAMLSARQGDKKLAAMALEDCLKLMPGSAIVRRALIGITEGDEAIVKNAYKRCPYDSEIMLAYLVTETKSVAYDLSADKSNTAVSGSNSAATAWATNMVDNIIASDGFSPGTLVRAGSYMLSKGQVDLAAKLAREAIAKGRGLLSAYVLGLRVALLQGDAEWANSCALSGIENALDPTPFYKVLVELKAAGHKIDRYLIEALEYLQEKKSSESQWSEMLGKIYFQKGDMSRSLSIFSSVMSGDTKNINIGTLIIAAEAARRNSKMDKAVSILESAYTMRPDNLAVLNNLVYLLSQNPDTLSRASALLPKLLDMGGDSFAVMDTAAIVYLRSGDLKKAQMWMNKAMGSINNDSYSAQEVKLNAAEIQMRSGKYEEARRSIGDLRKDSSRTDYIDQKARGLLRDIESLGNGM